MNRLDLHTFRMQGRRSLPYFLTSDVPAGVIALVTRKLGFPYVLDTVMVGIQSAPLAQIGLQLFVSDDNDIADPANLTGERVFTATSLSAPDNPQSAWFDIEQPWRCEPSFVVERAPTFIKAHLRTGASGSIHVIALDIVPMDWDVPRF